MKVKKRIKKLMFLYKNSSYNCIKYLRNIGVSVGENVYILCPTETNIDTNIVRI